MQVNDISTNLYNQQDLDELARALSSKRALLFIGAGFSKSSRNLNGQELPLANDLANKIGELGSFDAESDLQYASEKFLREGNDDDLIQLLTNLYTVSQCSEESNQILKLKYRRIYTTNYDDLIEKSSNKNGFSRKSLSIYDNPKDYYKYTDNCVHINGSIQDLTKDSLNKSFKLTESSYLLNSDSFVDSDWKDPFRKDLESATAIIFLGFSLEYDLDIKKILYEDSLFKDKTYFILRQNPSERKVSKYIKFGKVLDIEIKGFADFIEKTVIQSSADEKYHMNVFSELEEEETLDNIDITDKDIENLLTRGSYEYQKILLSNSAPYVIKRKKALDDILNLLQNEEDIISVTSEFGNGKSILLLELKKILLEKGYKVFELIDYEMDFKNDLEVICNIQNGIILLDNYTDRLELIEYFLTLNPYNTKLIVFDRVSNNAYALRALEDFNPLEVNIDTLTTTERSDFIDLLTHIGAWGELSGHRDAIERKFKNDYKNQISLMLLDLYESEQIKSELDKLVHPLIMDMERKKIILSVFVLSLMNLQFSRSLIEDMSDSKLIQRKEIFEDTSFKNLFRITTDFKIELKSTLLSRYIVKNYFTNPYLKDFFLQLVIKANERKKYDKNWDTIQRELFRFHFVEQLVSSDNKKAFLNSYFDLLKKDHQMRWLEYEPHYWLQYAMANISNRDYSGAQHKLTSAYEYARNKGGYYSAAIDNQQARLYILQAYSKELRGDQSFDMFLKADSLLSLNLNEDNIKYDAKQLSEYKKIYNMKYQDFPKKSKVVFIKKIEKRYKELLAIEQDEPMIFHASPEFFRCKSNLDYILQNYNN